MRNLKRTLITVKPKDSAINGDPQELQDPQQLLRRISTLFGVLIMVYDRVNDGDKFPKKLFVSEGFVLSFKGLTRTGQGIINCFYLHGIFTGDVSSISDKCDNAFIINFEISLVNFLKVLGFLLLKSEKTEAIRF